jgi:hypothetical protein
MVEEGFVQARFAKTGVSLVKLDMGYEENRYFVGGTSHPSEKSGGS